IFRYTGLDDLIRSTRIHCVPAPTGWRECCALYSIELPPGAHATVELEIACLEEGKMTPRPASGFVRAMRIARCGLRQAQAAWPQIITDNELFNQAITRSVADLVMLVTDTEDGPYPYAGIPWFSTAFGRDAIITALQTMWLVPAMARGVLLYLAANQATEVNAAADSEPGKILHEVRHGEMALLGEVPFRRYYGSVDSTPLFVVLAGAYFARTGDVETIRKLWPHVEAAITWIDEFGDADGDGFVEYGRRTAEGLINQGWKDSFDSIFHADSSLARGPIALSEVQAYVFAARRAAADMALALGFKARGATLSEQARVLREKVEAAFWDDELGLYVLALDGQKRPCRVAASNAGHMLFAGLPDEARARVVAGRLVGRGFWTGWGIRTVASDAARYNPMSYHNGSVWPHDNTVIAAGFARYGLAGAAAKVLCGLFDTAMHTDLQRLPELFCGFPRMRNQGPTNYPVACSPQAWAAGALPGCLAACLGITFDPADRTVRFNRPVLPEFLTRVRLQKIELCGARIDILLHRTEAGAIAMAVTDRQGDIRAMMTS
ncbi:MAG TPA: amylo-alpha-1,6-glucosidase, partial [Acetobacteraceae bacterium]|nr:amylo-alpha-1,6-glucosidase [Acetobacteraceae bacterium]